MISLKESILASTDSGIQKYVNEVKTWVYNTQTVSNCVQYIQDIEITVYKNDLYKINILSKPGSRKILYNNIANNFTIRDNDCKGSDIYRKIYEICLDSAPLDIIYVGLNFKSSEEFVKNGDMRILLYGCDVYRIDSLPKFCEELRFNLFYKVGEGRRSCTVEKIEKLKLKSLIVGYSEALYCDINNIKNNTIDKVIIWDYMLSSDDCVNRVGHKFTLSQNAVDQLKLFVNNNNIKELELKFYYKRNEYSKTVQFRNDEVELI